MSKQMKPNKPFVEIPEIEDFTYTNPVPKPEKPKK